MSGSQRAGFVLHVEHTFIYYIILAKFCFICSVGQRILILSKLLIGLLQCQ